LLWLVSACALQRRLARASDPVQTLVAAALGAVGAFAGWLLFGLAADLDASWWPALPTAVAGGVLGAATVHWLRMRNRSALPADTSARLAELQSRIRPHFLFNTLNTAMALVRVDPRRAEDLLADLAELFRVALDAGYDAVTLADEIELARRYLEIEQLRFGARLQVQWDLDAQADGVRVPALLLQPLLENAVRHGVEPAPEGGTIRVRTRVRRGVAVVGIDNSVSGLPSQPGRGIALRNVRERLRLMHDVAAQFEARRDGDTFRVQIVLPLPT
jgi:two-component system sensor histidine kinase AlgZ